MGANHDQFSHFSHLRPGSSAAILEMVVVWPQIGPLVVFGLQIGPGPRGQCRLVVCALELWCCQGDRMGVNHDQFSHFSHLRPRLSTIILQMVVILATILTLVAFGLQIGPGPRGQCRQVVVMVGLWCRRGDRIGVKYDQFFHFSHLRPRLSTIMLQMVVILIAILTLVRLWAPNRARCTWSV